MKKNVLCVARHSAGIPSTTGIHSYDFSQVQEDDFLFVNRKIVDSKEPKNTELGSMFPQVLPYVTIHCGEHVLIYSRSKGAEERLHGSLSLGFGGHVDIDDFHADHGYKECIKTGVVREIQEELNLNIAGQVYIKDLTRVIVDNTNQVGQVHLGLPLALEVASHEAVEPDPEETYQARWVDVQWLQENVELFESWSQMLIKQL